MREEAIYRMGLDVLEARKKKNNLSPGKLVLGGLAAYGLYNAFKPRPTYHQQSYPSPQYPQYYQPSPSYSSYPSYSSPTTTTTYYQSPYRPSYGYGRSGQDQPLTTFGYVPVETQDGTYLPIVL